MGDFKAWWHRRVYISYWISYWLPVALWYGSALRCQEQIQRNSAPSRPEDARPLQWHDLAFLDRSYAYQLGGVSCAVPPWNPGLQISMRKVKTTWGWKAGPCGKEKDVLGARTFRRKKGRRHRISKSMLVWIPKWLGGTGFSWSSQSSLCLSQVSYWWPTWNWLCMLPGSIWAIPQKVQDTCGQW